MAPHLCIDSISCYQTPTLRHTPHFGKIPMIHFALMSIAIDSNVLIFNRLYFHTVSLTCLFTTSSAIWSIWLIACDAIWLLIFAGKWMNMSGRLMSWKTMSTFLLELLMRKKDHQLIVLVRIEPHHKVMTYWYSYWWHYWY